MIGPPPHMMRVDLRVDTSRESCPSAHSTMNKAGRLVWGIVWWMLFRCTPRVCWKWRVWLLRLFGARISWQARLDPTVRIWAPWNLVIGKDVAVGHHVDLYNVATISIASNATVSQYSYLCAASHDVNDPRMRLVPKPIRVHSSAWLCAKSFVGPGVTIGNGAVVGACCVAVRDIPPWTIVAGNPAREIRKRTLK